MKNAIVWLSPLAVAALALPTTAFAQETVPPPVQYNPTPNPQAIQPQAAGQWVQLGDGSWVWVPANATTYAVDGVPYAYLYTPVYGWTWYASPWGWGPFVLGAWVGHPWPFGFRAWANGAGGWGWRGYGGQGHSGYSHSGQNGGQPLIGGLEHASPFAFAHAYLTTGRRPFGAGA